MIHELKTWPQYYCRVASGSKLFEVRKNDRGFQPGDSVELREYDPNAEEYHDEYHGPGYTTTGKYTNKPILKFKIGYVLPIDSERVVFSLLPLDKESHE